MNLLISGANGLVGTALEAGLTQHSYNVYRLVRHANRPGQREVSWDPATKTLDANHLAGADAVVHLAGEPIASGRWNSKKKKAIRDSRVEGTRFLAERLCAMARKPQVVIVASAIGYYGDRGDEVLTEESSNGSGFLAGVCREWEAAADPLREASIRTIHARFGVILSPKGGALATMLPPFKLGAGGVIAGGKQFMSWISIDDVVGALRHMIETDSLQGPVNVVGPNPVTNREFTKALGGALGKPTLAPMPGFAARLAFGEMAGELLLASQNVQPTKLKASGFKFAHTDLTKALTHLLQS